MTDVLVIGAGPAGVLAALRAAALGAQTPLVTSGAFGGMAANDGPVPVRTLAHAGRLMREARQLGQYGVKVSEPVLDYSRLLARVREVVTDVCAHSSLRQQIDAFEVTVHEQAGAARFVDSHTIETKGGLRLEADKIIICTGGVKRRLPIAGFELTSTHSDAWRLTSVPQSMLVIGTGATGVQVASIFNALGSRVQLFETGPRILPTEDESVSVEAAAVFRELGMMVRKNFGTIDSFEKTETGVRMNFSKDSQQFGTETAIAIVAISWMADTTGLSLAAAGVELNQRKFVKVDDYLRTAAPHIFAASDIIGRMMLVPQPLQGGFVAATNAVQGPKVRLLLEEEVAPTGAFTEPEYAQVGLTEAKPRQTNDVVTSTVNLDSTTRTTIAVRRVGFCKLVLDRQTAKILGCHVIAERAVDIAEVAAIVIAAGMRVDDLARTPLSHPTYAGMRRRQGSTRTWPRDRLASAPGGLNNLASVNRASQAASRNRPQQRERSINSCSHLRERENHQ
jgi:pyruvate/2-oxoglutarate dehydrogenase complex dihydrolipoamide dehydrogenase (E3) component